MKEGKRVSWQLEVGDWGEIGWSEKITLKICFFWEEPEGRESVTQKLYQEDILSRGNRKGKSFEGGIISVSQETKTVNVAKGRWVREREKSWGLFIGPWHLPSMAWICSKWKQLENIKKEKDWSDLLFQKASLHAGSDLCSGLSTIPSWHAYTFPLLLNAWPCQVVSTS